MKKITVKEMFQKMGSVESVTKSGLFDADGNLDCYLLIMMDKNGMEYTVQIPLDAIVHEDDGYGE